MELVKDIYFNTDKLVENTNVKVSYTGKFYQGNNDKVFIHYGYGKNWENVQEVEMKKTDLGYQAELNLKGDETINFCFKNQNNEWDNNLGKNYIFNIEKATVNSLGETTVGIKEEAGSFFGKTFGEEEKASNVYFNAEIEPEVKNIEQSIDAELADGIVFAAPNSFDAEIAPVSNFESIAGVVSGEEIASSINADISADLGFAPISNTAPAVAAVPATSTALVVANNRSFAWTKKVKATVVKFFASVPKFISGNYKRIIGKKNK